jgi:hypothetical protein
MARRRPAPQGSGFTLGNLTNLGAIPLLTAIVTLSGFYYVTKDQLARQGEDIKVVTKTVTEKTTEDALARAKIRDDFIAAQIKTNEGIAKLDTRLAVAETNQKVANDTLTKIADSLQKITTLGSNPK